MRVYAYSVFDHKTVVYGVPFFAPTDGSAVRSFQDLANDLNTTVGRHPGDFALFCVGEYDDQKGVLLGMSPVRHIVDAVALLNAQGQLPLQSFQETTDELARRNANGSAA